MCEFCFSPTRGVGRDAHELARAVAVGRVAHALGYGPALRVDDPTSLSWLIAKEAALIDSLELVVNEYGAAYFDRILAALEDMKEIDAPLTGVDVARLESAINATLEEAAVVFAAEGGPLIGSAAAEAYGEVRKYGGVGADFSLVDKDAMAWMSKEPGIWVKEHYADAVTRVRKISQHGIKMGSGRVELATKLQSALESEVKGYRYWDVVASSNLNRARAWGVYESMHEQGVERVQWVTAGDESVCPVCGPMDGTTFSVGRAVERQRAIVKANPTPAEYRDQNPWIGVRGKGDEREFYWKDSDGEEHDVTDLFSGMTAGSSDDGGGLQDIGVNAPPVHGRCRCALDPVG